MNYKENRWTKEDEQFLIDNMQNMSNREMGFALDRNQKSIVAKLHRLGITRNDYKFTKYTEKNDIYNNDAVLGYVCGVMATDGSVTSNPCKRVSLYLHYEDKDMVQFIIDNLIDEKYQLISDGKNCLGFILTVPIFTNYLENIGIIQNKTKTLNVNIDDKSDVFRLYFLRGAIDGDGCISINDKYSHSYISITSSSEMFLLTLQKYFDGVIKKRYTGYYDLFWHGYDARKLSKLLPVDGFTMKRKTILIEQLNNIKFFCEENPYGHGIQKRKNRFIARIQYNKERLYIGIFEKLEDAQAAYNKKAIEFFGDKAKLNKVGDQPC